jgi:hypothetical protein
MPSLVILIVAQAPGPPVGPVWIYDILPTFITVNITTIIHRHTSSGVILRHLITIEPAPAAWYTAYAKHQ